MMIKSVAAAGALGVGLGVASLVGAGTAAADCGDLTAPPLERARCLTQANLASFGTSISPQYNIDVLLNGTTDNPELGLLDQPKTFVDSLKTFASGPVAPDGPPAPDTTPPGSSTGN